MITSLLIAGAAGCASALMFASIISGALISLVLFYLAPLPLMVAAMGWGPTSAALGGLVAGLVLGSIFGIPYCAAFVLTVALPAWWLGHLALLGRPLTAGAPNTATPNAPQPIEWYPLGRILIWVAGFAALTTAAALLTLGSDAPTITETLTRVPDGHPLAAGPGSPLLLGAQGTLLVILIAGLTAQIMHLRGQGASETVAA